ncbi:MAG: DNA repair exonuclease [Caldilineaceae bacterium]|nr:DNA repair exonuclease [Caldilineaceae bacterium]
MLRILHTADIHLDGNFKFLGEKGQAHRQQIERTFDRIVELARSDGYHLLLIAGDLFDSPHPSRRTVEHVKQQLGTLPIPVCILPGNHDALQPQSVYSRERFPANVHIFRDTPTYLPFPEWGLVIGGTPCTDSRGSALAAIRRPDPCTWFVVMAHGNMEIPGFVDAASRPLRASEIDALQADYVALGDWHALQEYSRPGVKVYYPGAPEPTTRSQEQTGHVLSVTLNDQGVQVSPLRVGRVRCRTVSQDVTNLDEAQLLSQLRGQTGADLLLSIQLRGMRAMQEYIDLAALQESLEASCYALHISDESTLTADAIALDDFPENQVIGEFIRIMLAQIKQSPDPDQRRIDEQALQVGVALLQGKAVLR